MRTVASQCLAGLTLLVVSHAPLGSQSQALPSQSEVAAAVERLVPPFLSNEGPSGVSIVIVRNGETLVSGGWGLANREARTAATAETSYRIGSITKQFTAAAVLRLVDRRRIALSDGIGVHLNGLPAAWHGVTIEQLLNHTAGIPDFTEIGGRWTRHWRDTMPPASLVALVANDKMSFAPGSAWQYSNTGYVVLGMLLETISGRSYGELIESEFSGPLGLTRTRVCEDAAGANGQAIGYQRDGRSFDIAGYRHVSHWFGGGGLCSTVGDLAKWNAALHGGRVLEPATYTLMVTPRGAAVKDGYGFGLMSRMISGRRELTHSGQFSGFAAFNAWYPEQSVSVAVLTNTAPTPTKDILGRNLALMTLGAPVTLSEPVAGTAADAAALRQYAGEYVIQVPGRPGLGLRVWVDGKVLKAQAERQRELTLHPTGAHTFGTALDPSIRFIFTVESNRVTGLVFEQAGAKYETVKKR